MKGENMKVPAEIQRELRDRRRAEIMALAGAIAGGDASISGLGYVRQTETDMATQAIKLHAAIEAGLEKTK